MARALDGLGQHALELGAGTGLTTRGDLAALGNEGAQQFNILVIDVIDFVGFELAELALAVVETTTGTPAATAFAADGVHQDHGHRGRRDDHQGHRDDHREDGRRQSEDGHRQDDRHWAGAAGRAVTGRGDHQRDEERRNEVPDWFSLRSCFLSLTIVAAGLGSLALGLVVLLWLATGGTLADQLVFALGFHSHELEHGVVELVTTFQFFDQVVGRFKFKNGVHAFFEFLHFIGKIAASPLDGVGNGAAVVGDQLPRNRRSDDRRPREPR